jgi:pimeloyl-ACP methyl ester carboxylesterase
MDKPRLIFVHGFLGHPKLTWASLADLIRHDPRIGQHYELDSYAYPATLFSSPPVQAVADGLRAFIDTRVPAGASCALIAHSLGGLVARKYVTDRVKRGGTLNVSRLFLFASPNTGTDLANLGRYAGWWNRQLSQLCRGSDFVRQLNEDWHIFRLAQRLPTRFIVGGLDRIVGEESARGFWGNDNVDVVIGANHLDIVKPNNSEHLSFALVAKYLADDLPRIAAGNVDPRRSWGDPIVTGQLLEEIFGLLEGLSEEHVRLLARLARLQMRVGAYTIVCHRSRGEHNPFHDFLRALRNSRLVKASGGGRFDVGRQAIVQPWGLALLKAIGTGSAGVVTPNGRTWAAILAEVDAGPTDSELRKELDDASSA